MIPVSKRIDIAIACVILILMLAISYMLANIIWGLLNGFQVMPDELDVSSPATQVNVAPVIEVRQMNAWNLFGEYKAKVVERKPKAQTVAPKTTLKLTLQGVFHGETAEDSTAIIAERGKTGELYRVGDKVSRGVKLDAVYSDRVILLRNGNLEALYFNESFKPGASSFKISPTDNLKKVSPAITPRSTTQAKNARSRLGKMVASGKAHSPTSIVKAITEDLETNPEEALSELGLESGGLSQGYKIGRQAPRDLLRALGLRTGDTILSVNGQSLGNMGSDAQLIRSAMSGGKVRVEIQRGSRRFTVNVDVP